VSYNFPPLPRGPRRCFKDRDDSYYNFFLDEPDEEALFAAIESAVAADDRRHALGRRSILASYGGEGLDRLH
jgi:hypothetical protein